jgi:hypothetical protein
MFDQGTWTEVNTARSPPARESSIMIYRGTKNVPCDGAPWYASGQSNDTSYYVILYGGSSGTRFLGDTWAFTQGNWFQLHPSGSPPAMSGPIDTGPLEPFDYLGTLWGGSDGSTQQEWWYLGESQGIACNPPADPTAMVEGLLGTCLLAGSLAYCVAIELLSFRKYRVHRRTYPEFFH